MAIKMILFRALLNLSIATLAAARQVIDVKDQMPISKDSLPGPSTTAIPVYGNNNATFGPVPKNDQLLSIEFLEIAPTPIIPDQFFFVLLRGDVPKSISAADLTDATLSVTLSAMYKGGDSDQPNTYVVPLRTETYTESAHIAIRNEQGAFTEHMTAGERNDILADFVIIKQFLRTGDWTFEIVAQLPDGEVLFAVSLTQFLEGEPRNA